MSECKVLGCSREVGEQDREDYNDRRFCSVQCETKWEHIKADAREAQRDQEPEPRPAPGREP